ncbi:hypothetical protein [Sporosarcina sp. P33]|uniref:hypothetical protein n=1 Tax=Sporosarcina sp. P33 TaxID=1930764 RepID=UPI0009C0A57B|nr:hypothetical protein [Sporosarcina sp. P33]ARD47510.1 hypothetical protein SporoP33_04170 [Sporosarcina sp. P33]
MSEYDEYQEESFKLIGKEFVTTIFDPLGGDDMILILGDNLDGQMAGPTFLYLYLSRDGEVKFGVETFVFFSPEKAKTFVEHLPSMSALEFIFKTIGIRPGYYEN